MVNVFKSAVSRYAKGIMRKWEIETLMTEKTQTLLIDEKINDKPVKVRDCTDCKIIKCDFSYNKEDQTMLTLENCVRCTVSECEFHDKDTHGLMIKIIGERPRTMSLNDANFMNSIMTVRRMQNLCVLETVDCPAVSSTLPLSTATSMV